MVGADSMLSQKISAEQYNKFFADIFSSAAYRGCRAVMNWTAASSYYNRGNGIAFNRVRSVKNTEFSGKGDDTDGECMSSFRQEAVTIEKTRRE